MEIDDKVTHSGTKSLKIMGIAATGIPFHTKVCHDIIPASTDEILTIAFWAKVDAEQGENRRLELSVRALEDSWPGFHNEPIVLDSTDWKEYTHTFVITKEDVREVWVGLSVAESDVSFWIDDFRVFEGGPDDETGKNYVETAVSAMDKTSTSWGSIKKGL